MALVLSRFILLDAMLVAANVAAILAFVKMTKATPLSSLWWGWLLATGLALAIAISIKFTSFFTVLLVGLLTLDYLNKCWDLPALSLKQLAAMFAGKLALLIALPVTIYLALYALHFALLPKSGSGTTLAFSPRERMGCRVTSPSLAGDAFMSMAFQRGLVNNPFSFQQAAASEVANLSLITLKPAHQEGGWLHSHSHRYPIYPSGDKTGLVSSYQQQVSLCQSLSSDRSTTFYYRSPSISLKTMTTTGGKSR